MTVPNLIADPPTAAAVTHALVIGVSSYPHASGPGATPVGRRFGLEPLTSAARSASEFAAWLVDEYHHPDAPLASLRVLLSPADGEQIDRRIEGLIADAGSSPEQLAATSASARAALAAFRAGCHDPIAAGEQRATSDVAIVYVAGHGIQLSKHGAILLLADFGDAAHLNVLDGALDVIGCQRGFDGYGYPAEQFWFVDACRQQPAAARRFESLIGPAVALDEPLGGVDSTAVFLASSTRESAFAETGGTSLFAQALLWSVRGGAAKGPDSVHDGWHVRTSSLIDALRPRVRALAGQHGALQNVDVTGRPGLGVLQRFDCAPDVDLSVTLAPPDAATCTTARLRGGGTSAPPDVVAETWPLVAQVPAGLYVLDVAAHPPFEGHLEPINAVPPTTSCEVSVSGGR